MAANVCAWLEATSVRSCLTILAGDGEGPCGRGVFLATVPTPALPHPTCSVGSGATWPWWRETSPLVANTPHPVRPQPQTQQPVTQSCPSALVGFQVWMQTWPQVIIESAVIVKLTQDPWEIMWADPILRNPFYPIIIHKSLSKASGLTFEARYRNLFQDSTVVLISSVLLMLLLKVLSKTHLSHLTSAYYFRMLLGSFSAKVLFHLH